MTQESYTLSLCLLDFVPNLAFLAGAYFLVKTALLVRGRSCARMVMAGGLLVFLGGTLKAIWKLLYTTGVGDVRICSEAQFALLAPGFLALLVSVVLLTRRKADAAGGVPLLAMAPWKIPLLIVMTLSSIGAYGILATLAFRRRERLAGALFIVAVLCLFAMSGMAGGEQTITSQWIEESINSLGQIAFAVGSFTLYRSYRLAKGDMSCV
ncbi:MAG: hypothetical protein JXB35_12595 [Anaerolineae bacterium]|nr:hypothetical protein [Anaerolineae bacterium]